MGCQLKDNAEKDPDCGDVAADMCPGDCNGCPYYYYKGDADEIDDIERIIIFLRSRGIPCRRTSKMWAWPETFHMAINDRVYHLTLRKVTKDLEEEEERGMK